MKVIKIRTAIKSEIRKHIELFVFIMKLVICVIWSRIKSKCVYIIYHDKFGIEIFLFIL